MFNKLNDLLFHSIGSKIKVVAKVFAWIQIIVGFIASIILFFIGLFTILDGGVVFILISPLIAAAGCFLAWLDSVPLYGFGELVDNTFIIRKHLKDATITSVNTTSSLTNISSSEKANLPNSMPAVILPAHQESPFSQPPIMQEEAAVSTAKKQIDTPTLQKQLSYALAFTTDEGMINQLKRINDERVFKILQSPINTVREQIIILLKELE